MGAKVIEIQSLNDPGIEVFGTLTEAQLRNRLDTERGIFIAESPKVIRVALQANYEPLALLCERRHIEGDAADIIERCGDIPIYTGARELLSELTGYTLTRGVLCAMRRKAEPSVEEVIASIPQQRPRIVVIDAVCDTTNIGAIFRSAAALGIDAVLLTRSSCDPLNRRAIRVSMGSVFLVPWTWLDSYSTLQNLDIRYEMHVVNPPRNMDLFGISYAETTGATLSVAMMTGYRTLGDWLTGPRERKIIANPQQFPVLCINPREDLYMLCT